MSVRTKNGNRLGAMFFTQMFKEKETVSNTNSLFRINSIIKKIVKKIIIMLRYFFILNYMKSIFYLFTFVN